jgi:hypothetical protein
MGEKIIWAPTYSDLKDLTSILLLSLACPFNRKCTGKKAAKNANHPIASVKDDKTIKTIR